MTSPEADPPDGTATFSATGRDLRGAILDGERRLDAAGVPSPRADAELLAARGGGRARRVPLGGISERELGRSGDVAP